MAQAMETVDCMQIIEAAAHSYHSRHRTTTKSGLQTGRRLKKKRISYYLWSCGLRPQTPCNRENAVYLHAVLQVINSASPLRTSSAGFQMEPVKTIDEAGLLLPIRTEKTLC